MTSKTQCTWKAGEEQRETGEDIYTWKTIRHCNLELVDGAVNHWSGKADRDRE